MHWNELDAVDQLELIATASKEQPQLIFKHSTRCGISAGAKRRLDGATEALAEKFQLHYLDLIRYREVSNAIAERFSVRHESPQIIVLASGIAAFDMSHHAIEPSRILELVED